MKIKYKEIKKKIGTTETGIKIGVVYEIDKGEQNYKSQVKNNQKEMIRKIGIGDPVYARLEYHKKMKTKTKNNKF